MWAIVGGLKDESRMMRVLHLRGAAAAVVAVWTSVKDFCEDWNARRADCRRGSMVEESVEGSEESGMVSVAWKIEG